ncbi:ArdC family protein [Nocardia vermiculata]|uniref:ArdC family protein n=1 Tax=Nocardia vermiculata TaxID=257274 RepID=A0A846Y3S3_9NOCA|nr:ArdC family protein [Nocardia vermiculata]NKY53893.1 ArdC family protein [Nocardia vermiculata]
MARRRKYSDADRAARAAADKEIRDGGNELLSDPEAVAGMIGALARLTCPKLLRYSLGNVALIFRQADERGMTVTDVDSYKGWRNRGRSVRKGEKGLRINAPKGTEKTEADDNSTSEAPAEQADTTGEGDNYRVRFRMMPVFDISQTEGIEDFEDEPAAVEPVTEPAAAVRARLLEQFAALGYTVTEGATPGTDDNAHTITVSTGAPLEELAQALAALLTRPAADRPARPVSASHGGAHIAADAGPGIPLDLGEFGTGSAVAEIDHDAARVYYRVTAPSVRGTFTVEFADAAETTMCETRRVCVKYGRADKAGRAYGQFGEDRPERPTVNGIALASESTVTLTTADVLRWLYVARLYQGRYGLDTDQVPQRTGERVRAVVRAILAHFQTLPEFEALFTRAAALHAPALQQMQADRARELARHLASIEAQRQEAEARAQYFADLAAGRETAGAPPETFAS